MNKKLNDISYLDVFQFYNYSIYYFMDSYGVFFNQGYYYFIDFNTGYENLVDTNFINVTKESLILELMSSDDLISKELFNEELSYILDIDKTESEQLKPIKGIDELKTLIAGITSIQNELPFSVYNTKDNCKSVVIKDNNNFNLIHQSNNSQKSKIYNDLNYKEGSVN